MESPIPDPICAYLRAFGYTLEARTLFNNPHSRIFVGYRFIIRCCEMIYRLKNPETVIIVLYRRIDGTKGTAPFRDLIWFLDLIFHGGFGIQRAMGLVDTYRYRHDQGISSERLMRFYRDCMGGQLMEHDGSLWVYQDVAQYRTPRQYRRARRANSTYPSPIENVSQ